MRIDIKEVDRLRSELEASKKENEKLREALKWCTDYIEVNLFSTTEDEKIIDKAKSLIGPQ